MGAGCPVWVILQESITLRGYTRREKAGSYLALPERGGAIPTIGRGASVAASCMRGTEGSPWKGRCWNAKFAVLSEACFGRCLASIRRQPTRAIILAFWW